MHGINYEQKARLLNSLDIYDMLLTIHEYKGEQKAYMYMKSHILSDFNKSTIIQDIEIFNKIEGIFISNNRIIELYNNAKIKNEKEGMVKGAIKTLSIISNNYNKIFIQIDFIKRLHCEMFKYLSNYNAGEYRNYNYGDIDFSPFISNKKLLLPNIPHYYVKKLLNDMCLEYVRENAIGEFDNLLLIPIYILDFICLHPFSKGNFNFSILLFLLLLYKNGYFIGRYVSMATKILENIDAYIEVIYLSSIGFNDNKNDYNLFVKFCLNLIISSYTEFFELMKLSDNKEISKPGKVELIIKDSNLDKITKKEIQKLCPDISISTIEHTLNRLINENKIKKVGGGRSTGYIYLSKI